MKLLRLKITDPAGFRSLPCDFEHHFRTDGWSLQDELAQLEGFAPFVCAGPNGSGKSNLLEALAAIFFHMECIYLAVRPDGFDYDKDDNPKGFRSESAALDGFDIEYLTDTPVELQGECDQTRLRISKLPKVAPQWWVWHGGSKQWEKLEDVETRKKISTGRALRRKLLPDYILAYSSGENQILNLPFFKARFIQFDEYWRALRHQVPYDSRPEARLAYLDSSFSQAILICNLLFQDYANLLPFREDVGIEGLKEFRIILRRSIPLTRQQASAFIPKDFVSPREIQDSHFEDHKAIYLDSVTGDYRLNVIQRLEGDERTSIIGKLKRCATLHFFDEASDSLVFDYWVNDETKQAFRDNFDDSPIALFQALQVLLTLNLYSVSESLKADLYTSTSHYVSETVPTLASDERIMRFKFVRFAKKGVNQSMMLKDLSDGEHQLLHSLGMCLLFRETNSLFLLDEPETHFNPHWRANFITRLRQCFPVAKGVGQEMLLTTHTPFLISDSKPEKVLEFKKDESSGIVSVGTPTYNTLGASVNLITMQTFSKHETIGRRANELLQAMLSEFDGGSDPRELAKRIIKTMGDSIERSLAVHALLGKNSRSTSDDELA